MEAMFVERPTDDVVPCRASACLAAEARRHETTKEWILAQSCRGATPLAWRVFVVTIFFSAAGPLRAAEWIYNPGTGNSYLLTASQTFEQAEAEALSYGAHLVTINNEPENTWLFETFRDQVGPAGVAWIGFNDRTQEGLWVWLGGAAGGFWMRDDPSSTSFTLWRSGTNEPNDCCGGEDAAEMVFIEGPVGYWNDANTGGSKPGIIEHPGPPIPALGPGGQAALILLLPAAAVIILRSRDRSRRMAPPRG